MKKFLNILFLFFFFIFLFGQDGAKEKDSDGFKSSYSNPEPIYNVFGIGFGAGNPLLDVIFSFPYVHLEIGYEGFSGLNPNNFYLFY